MILSEHTLTVLKNFASINQSIFIRGGKNFLTTQSVAKTVVGEGAIEEQFPVDFCLYDLSEFLNTMKLFKKPMLQFVEGDNFMHICEETDQEFKVRYTFTKKEMIRYPEKRPQIKETDIAFKLDAETLESILNASKVMQLPNLIMTPGDEPKTIKMQVSDMKNSSSNVFSITLDCDILTDSNFKLIYNMDTFKMLPGDYVVSIQGSAFASAFESEKFVYHIGLDVNSVYGN